MTLALLLPVPSAADVLVTTDGARVETAGPWEVRGSTVVFRNPQGQLVSLPAGQVDLEASQQATTEAAEAAAREEAERAAPRPEPTRQAVMTLTDADVRHVNPRTLEPVEEDEAAAEEEESGEPEDPITVVDWSPQPDMEGAGTTISGRVRNTGDTVVGAIRLRVGLYDDEGMRLGSATASVTPGSLQPGAEGSFSVMVPNVLDFAAARFDTSSSSIATSPQPEADVPGASEEP